MKKNRMLRTALLSTVFTLLTIVLMTPVASAHTAALAHRTATATSQAPHVPNVNIITSHHRSVFSPSTIHCQSSSGQACFTITNLTQKTQQVLYTGTKGQAVAALPPGSAAGFGPVNPGPSIALFRLQANPQALLTAISS
jgi:hypothetical protein